MTYYKLNENVNFAARADTDVEEILKQIPNFDASSLFNKA